MAVLVTGGAGYIGSHMTLALLDADETPVVLDDLSNGFRWAVPEGVAFVEGDVGDQKLVDRIIEEHSIVEVIHFAGSVVVPESVKDPLKYYRNNTANSRNLIERCVRGGVERFIFSSTAAVYGIPERAPVVESDPMAPISPYGASKLMTEQMLRDVAAAHDLSYAALRYFNVAGADPDGRSGQSTRGATHLIKVASEAALGKRDKLVIYGDDYPTPDGTGVRDYIHVSDLADAHLSALRKLRADGGSYTLNCGYGRGFSVREVVAAVAEAAGAPLPHETGPRRAGDPPELVANNGRILETLDWRPERDDLGLIVRTALEWERGLSTR